MQHLLISPSHTSPCSFSPYFQFLPSSVFTQRAKPGSQAWLPACAAMPRVSPAPSWLGWRMAWTSQPSCPNSSPCKVQRSQEFTAYCMYTFIAIILQYIYCYCVHYYFTAAVTNTFTATIAFTIASATTNINVTIVALVWPWLLSILTITVNNDLFYMFKIGLGNAI